MQFEELVNLYRNNRTDRKVISSCLIQMKEYNVIHDDAFSLGRYHYYLAEHYYSIHDVKLCRNNLKKAYNLLIKYPTSSELISCYNIYGILADLRGDHSSAIEYYFKALDDAKIIHNKLQTLVILNNIGNLFLTQEDYKEAIKFYRQSLSVLNKMPKNSNIMVESTIRQYFTTAYARSGNIEQAIKQFELLKQIPADRFKLNKDFIVNYVESLILCQSNDLKEAKACASRLIQAIDTSLPVDAIRMLLEVIDLWLALDLDALVEHSLRVSYEVLKKINFIYFNTELRYACCKYSRKIDDQSNIKRSTDAYLKAIDDQNEINRLNSIISLKDKVELHKMSHILEETFNQSVTDQLTGLYNRHIINDLLESKLNYIKGKDLYLGIIIIDIDYFKNYNDKFGHLKGDKCLTRIAKIIGSYSDDNCIAVRFGGDEFILSLFDKSLDEIIKIANEIKKRVNKLKYCIDEHTHHYISVSQGIYYTKPYDDQNIFDYILRADKALYIAKEIKDTIHVLQ